MSLDPLFAQLGKGKRLSLEESMKYEAMRLATFSKRPRNYGTPASPLAHAGFYYTGDADVVECYKCGLRIGDWQSMDPSVSPDYLHEQRSSACEFVTRTDCENIPYNVHESELQDEVRQMKNKLEQISKARAVNGNVTSARESTFHSESTFQSNNIAFPSNTRIPQNAMEQRLPQSDSSGDFQPSLPVFDSPPAPPLITDDPEDRPDFKKEQTRLETYIYWPNGSAVRPAELAKAGFYYLGTEDRVQCAFCKGVLRNWDPTDVALDEHKKHFPACPFIRDPHAVGNVPMLEELSHIRMRREVKKEEIDDCMKWVMTDRAYHPHMATHAQRLESFFNFRSNSVRSPQDFAEAGFFSTGHGDNVKCFFCDGGLRNWERNDDPWLEHARWFPKCGYLRARKGEDYVERINKRYAPPGKNKPKAKKLKRRYDVNPAEVEKIMNSEIVIDVTQLDYSLSAIKATVERRLAELGKPFPNMESLVEALNEADEVEQQSTDSETELHQHEAVSEKQSGAKEGKEKKKSVKAAHINPFDLMSLEKDSEIAAKVEQLKEERICKICMDKEVNIVFVKCGHLVCCGDCALVFRHCPMCREVIRGTIRVALE